MSMQDSGSLIASLLPLVVLFAVFYFLIIRPQQKQAAQHKAMILALEKGDKIVTSGGLIVEIEKVEDEFLTVVNIDGSKMRLAKDFISKKLEK
jgi:preprotein translocase subunit YajC